MLIILIVSLIFLKANNSFNFFTRVLISSAGVTGEQRYRGNCSSQIFIDIKIVLNYLRFKNYTH